MDKPRILIAEDEGIITLDIKSILIQFGYNVVAAVISGEDAVRKTEELRPDLVLMDIVLAGEIDGIQAAMEIKKSLDVPVIYMTANADQATVERARATEPFGYINKPINERDLFTSLDTALYKHGMERRLRESEERYRQLVENISDVIYVLDASGRVSYVSPVIERISQYNVQDVAGRLFTEFIYPPDLPGLLESYGRTVSGQLEPYEFRILDKDGSLRFVRTSSRLIVKDGMVTGLTAVMTDITERRRAEAQREAALEELRESERRLSSIIQGLPIPSFVIGRDHKVLYWNRALEKLSGIEAGRVIGTNRHWKAFYASERPCMADLLVDELQNKISEWYAGKYSASTLLEESYEATDFFPALGEKGAWLRFTAAVIHDSTGSIMGALETLEDITEKKEADVQREAALDALRKSEFQYRSTLDAMADPLHVVDSGLRIILINEAFRRWCGELEIDLSDVEGKSVTEVFQFLSEDVIREYGRVFATGKILVSEESNTYAGREIFTETRKIPIIRDGKAERVITIVRDISERKHSEEKLREIEERYNTLFERSFEAVYVNDFEGNFLDANGVALDMVGYARDDIASMNFLKILDEDQLPSAVTAMKEVLTLGRMTEPIELKLRKKNGELVWAEVMGSCLYRQGKPYASLGLARNITGRKRTEEALREAEANYRGIFENSIMGIYRSTPGGRFVMVNPAFARIMGYDSPEELVAAVTDIKNQVYARPEDRDETLRRLEDGDIRNFEFQVRRKDGSTAWISNNIHAIRDAHGGIASLEGVVQDITERKRMEARWVEAVEALRKSEEQYKSLTERMDDILWTLDLNLRTTYVSPSIQKALGFTPGERMKQSLEEMLAPESLVFIRNLFEEELRKEAEGARPDRVLNFELEYRHKNGSRVWTENVVSGIRDEHGALTGIQGLSRSITRRKEAEAQREAALEALRQSEEKARVILNATTAAVILLDREGTVLDTNSAYPDRIGKTREEFIGRSLWEFFPAEIAASRREAMEQVFRSGSVARATDFSAGIWSEYTVYPVFDESGAVKSVAVYAQDVTRRKCAEERLRKSLEEKEILLRELQHRVKNNLALISSLLSLESNKSADPVAKSVLEDSQNRIKTLAALYGRLYASENIASIDLGRYVEDLARSMFASYSTAKGRIQFSVSVGEIMTDMKHAVPLGLILNELLTNALKYAFPEERSGKIEVELDIRGKCCDFAFRDDGAGLPEGFSFKDTDTMGLSLIRLLVEQLDGTIEIDGKNGTSVRISFPLQPGGMGGT